MRGDRRRRRRRWRHGETSLGPHAPRFLHRLGCASRLRQRRGLRAFERRWSDAGLGQQRLALLLVVAQRDHFAAQLADELRQRRIVVARSRLRDHLGQPAFPLRPRASKLGARLLQLDDERGRPLALRLQRPRVGGEMRRAREQSGEPDAFGLQLRALQPGRLRHPRRVPRFLLGLRASVLGGRAARLRRRHLAGQLGDPPLEEDDLFQRGAEQVRCRRWARRVALAVRQAASRDGSRVAYLEWIG